LILSTLGTNASVDVDLILRDMTTSQNLHVEPIHSLDLKTHSYKIITAGFDHNDSGAKVDTFPAILRRGHTYRLTLRLITTLFVIAPSGTQSICDYLGGFTGGQDGAVELNSLFVKVGLDEKEVLEQLNNFADHRHIYLTGKGVGHNNVEAESSSPVGGSKKTGEEDLSSPPMDGPSDPGERPIGKPRPKD
jgi:hypothetical protein